MNEIKLPSKFLDNAVRQLAKLPGVGNRTALRLALHLLNQSEEDIHLFSNSLIELKEQTCFCQKCFNISDQEICEICANPYRDQSLVCVVESIKEVMAIEFTQQFRGVYHVLGGVISPIDGIGPQQLKIEELVQRISEGNIKEIIFALSTTMEGDTTNFFIHKKIKDSGVNTSMLARGVSVGDSLEYADQLTLGRSIINRMPYQANL